MTIESILHSLPTFNTFPRQRSAYCQPSTGTPVIGDITSVIAELKGYAPDGLCSQAKPEAKDCPMLVKQTLPSAAKQTLRALEPIAKLSAQYRTQRTGRAVYYKSELEGEGHQLQGRLKEFEERWVVTAAGRDLLLYFSRSAKQKAKGIILLR